MTCSAPTGATRRRRVPRCPPWSCWSTVPRSRRWRVRLRAACAVADQALAELAAEGALRPGRTELQVGRELDARMLTLGAEAPSFETIVATGANSAIPHHRPDATVLREGE